MTQNDLGISEDDEEAIWANLTAQGLADVVEVEFNSGKKIKAGEVNVSRTELSVNTTASTGAITK
jgi:hypothetical protein